MNTTSKPKHDLVQRLHKKTAERLAQTENLIEQNLSGFETKFRKRLTAAERSMSSVLSKLIEASQITQYRLWLTPLIVGLSLSLGLSLGSGISLKVLTSMIADRIQTLDRHQQALEALDIAGIEYQTHRGNLYLITPNANRPTVYQNEQYHGRWIIKLED